MTWAEQTGGGKEVTFGADTDIYPWSLKCLTAVATAGGLRLKLPDIASPFLSVGLQAMVWNAGSNSFSVTLADNTVLQSVAAGQICRVTFNGSSYKTVIL